MILKAYESSIIRIDGIGNFISSTMAFTVQSIQIRIKILTQGKYNFCNLFQTELDGVLSKRELKVTTYFDCNTVPVKALNPGLNMIGDFLMFHSQ